MHCSQKIEISLWKNQANTQNIFIVPFPGGSLQYMNDPSLKLVFTSEDPSLVVLFDQRSGLHSVWKLRKATPQVCLSPTAFLLSPWCGEQHLHKYS